MPQEDVLTIEKLYETIFSLRGSRNVPKDILQMAKLKRRNDSSLRTGSSHDTEAKTVTLCTSKPVP